MPTSRPGSAPVEFWVDGSRRDGAVEEFYTLSSELGRSGPHRLFGRTHTDPSPDRWRGPGGPGGARGGPGGPGGRLIGTNT
ncbi:hypothetical protein EYF80_066483 [Liparis tanakae]|uniref:Uncharacterized protein n=1 Tax=Liparis tanakae TaxID=230148 RepID=A0A4Z2E398_9TELE|nr:hypothetical protein EYF80_066483 [Liparis tanakae]